MAICDWQINLGLHIPLFTWDQTITITDQTTPVRLLFTQGHSRTVPQESKLDLQKRMSSLDLFYVGSRMVPCKEKANLTQFLDQIHMESLWAVCFCVRNCQTWYIFTWVVFPDPVSPTSTKAWCSFMLSMNFSLYSHTGSSILFLRMSKYLSENSFPLKGFIFPRRLLGLLRKENRF